MGLKIYGSEEYKGYEITVETQTMEGGYPKMLIFLVDFEDDYNCGCVLECYGWEVDEAFALGRTCVDLFHQRTQEKTA